MSRRPRGGFRFIHRDASCLTHLASLRMPVIVAISGGCIGGAVDLVTACCIRCAPADAFFCIQKINIGMVADAGMLQRLPKLILEAVVKEYACTGRRMPAVLLSNRLSADDLLDGVSRKPIAA